MLKCVCTLICTFGVVISASNFASAKPKYSAIVLDRNSGKTLYSRHADAKRYPASLTKMMTLYIVFDLIDSGRLSYRSQLRVTTNASSQQPSKLGLKVGTKISLHNAIRALVTKSANDVAVTIAENLAGTEAKFARIMTWKAREIGMKNSVFKNASGLPNRHQITTARDMAILGDRLISDFPKHYSFFKTRYFAYKGRSYRNHNSLLHNFKGTDGIKTGYTRASGFNLVASVKRGGKHLIGVVMGGKSSRHRNANMRSILASAFKKATRKRTRPLLIAKSRRRTATPMIAALKPDRAVPRVRGRSNPSSTRVALRAPIPQPVLRRPAHLRPQPKPQPRRRYALAAAQPFLLQPRMPASQMPASQMRASPAPAPVRPVHHRRNNAHGPFHIQVGAYATMREAESSLIEVRKRLGAELNAHQAFTAPYNLNNQKLYYRARFAGFTRSRAAAFCDKVKAVRFDCIVMRAE